MSEAKQSDSTAELGLRFVGYAVIATTKYRGNVVQLSKPDMRKAVADRCRDEWGNVYSGENIAAEVCEVFVRLPNGEFTGRPQACDS